MAFESIRKFQSVRKNSPRDVSDLSLGIYVNSVLKNGESSYVLSIKIGKNLLSEMNWGDGTRVDLLVDEDARLVMLKNDPYGLAISFPNRTDNIFNAGYIKVRLPKAFDYIPKDMQSRVRLNLVEKTKDSIVFEMPVFDKTDNSVNEPVFLGIE